MLQCSRLRSDGEVVIDLTDGSQRIGRSEVRGVCEEQHAAVNDGAVHVAADKSGLQRQLTVLV